MRFLRLRVANYRGIDTREVRDQFNSRHQEVRVQLEMLAKNLNHARDNLDRARKTVADDRLDGILADAARAVAEEESRVRSAEASLRAGNPERVKASVETARGSLRTTQSRLMTASTELTEVQTRLKIHGEERLHEKLNAAQSRCEHLEKDNIALFRRAAAARLLFDTMRDERDKTRRAYVAPLKEKIEQLEVSRPLWLNSCAGTGMNAIRYGPVLATARTARSRPARPNGRGRR
jgi:hypothetical protein